MMLKLLIWSFLVASPEIRNTQAFCHQSLARLHPGVSHEELKVTSASPLSVEIDLDSYITDMSHILALLAQSETEFFFEELKKKQSAFLEKNFGRNFIEWLRSLNETHLVRLKRIFLSQRLKSRNTKANQIRFILDSHLPIDPQKKQKLFKTLLNEYSLLRGSSRKIAEVQDHNGRIRIEKLRKRNLIDWNRLEGEPFWIEDLVPLESLQNRQVPLLFAITPNPSTKKMELLVAIDPESRDFEKDQLSSSLESQINLYTVHSHVARGRDVIFSGVIWINLKGEATHASLESGHYMLPRIKRIEEAINFQFRIPQAQAVLETLAEHDRERLARLLLQDFKLHFLAFDHLKERFFVRQNEWLSLFPRYSDR